MQKARPPSKSLNNPSPMKMEPPDIETNNTPPHTHGNNRRSLVQPNEIAVYIQRSSFQFDDIICFLTNVEPARFNFPKPTNLRLSDDAWAALQLRVDHMARNILDPHRYYGAAFCVSILIIIVFYAIRPGYDRQRIHAMTDERNIQDDDKYDDYIQDDLWERDHSMDDVVAAELTYLNSQLDKSLWIWRVGLIVSLLVLFGSVIFIVVLMERRNVAIDQHIKQAIEEIRPRVEDEGIAVEYRTRSSHPGMLSCLGKYIRPTRVVVFSYLDSSSPRSVEGGNSRTKNRSFFSEDYQRKYFPPPRSVVDDFSTVASSSFSFM